MENVSLIEKYDVLFYSYLNFMIESSVLEKNISHIFL